MMMASCLPNRLQSKPPYKYGSSRYPYFLCIWHSVVDMVVPLLLSSPDITVHEGSDNDIPLPFFSPNSADCTQALH